MEHTIDIDTIDYKIGEMSGIALAKVDGTLNEEQVVTAGTEAFDSMSISVVLSRSLFIAGHKKGYANWLGGLV